MTRFRLQRESCQQKGQGVSRPDATFCEKETVFRVSGYTLKGTATYEHVSFPPGLQNPGEYRIQKITEQGQPSTSAAHCHVFFLAETLRLIHFMICKKEAFSIKVVAVGILLIGSFVYITSYKVLLVCFDVLNV